jgi:hypothetical protein
MGFAGLWQKTSFFVAFPPAPGLEAGPKLA